jgi:soluble lytic murein transglycosylase-like protein
MKPRDARALEREYMHPVDRYDSLFELYAEWTRMDDVWTQRPTPLDWALMKRQAQAESGMNPDAMSPVGAKGLMQFMDATFAEWREQRFHRQFPPNRWVNPFDPEDSVWAACDMMSWLLKVWDGDYRKALASYNYGIGNVTKLIKEHGDAWEEHLPDETKGYLAKILPLDTDHST